MLENTTKICTKCKCEKDLHLFSARKKSKDGKALWCRDVFQGKLEKALLENHELYRNSHNTSREKHS